MSFKWFPVSDSESLEKQTRRVFCFRASHSLAATPSYRFPNRPVVRRLHKAVTQHPEAKRMMKDIERGHITGLVFSKLARLSRNRRELEDFADFFNRNRADLISLSESIDTSTA